MNGKIISVFPCSGKTHTVTKYYFELDCVDHDFYDWKYRSVHQEKIWLKHYLSRMHQLQRKFKFVFVNALPEIVNELPKDSIVIYPTKSLKSEWVERAKSRGGISEFPLLLEEKWNKWIDTCMNWYGKKYVLESGQYLTDIIKQLYGVKVNLNSMPGERASKFGYA